ncbi:MAG TPA: tryptophan synthase subunit alpha, partial [Deferrisomatales bacterium]|nr:tryptophan synthase subunit alpha [Deferrisomatales bacterium]
LDTVCLVAPTTPESRIEPVLAGCSGFAYCVSVAGVTGEKKPVAATVGELVKKVRAVSDLPALVGFGVSGPAAARSIAVVADGVIVGSALLTALGEQAGAPAVAAAGAFLRELRVALDG